MKVKINNIDEFCEALKAGYYLKDKYGSSMCVVKKGINIYGTTIDITFGDIYYEKPDPLKIECGKYYKTRDGHKVLVLIVADDSPVPVSFPVPVAIQGVVFTYNENKICSRNWHHNGYFRVDKEEDDLDIVSEWKEDK